MAKTFLFEKQLSEFDKKPFAPLLETEVYNTIQKEVKENEVEFSNEELAELIGFRFIESNNRNRDESQFYFKPFRITTNEDGTEKQFPSLSQINEAIISYWERRSKQALHPVLTGRYSGLVYDLALKITGKNPHYTIAQRYINALIDIVNQDLYKVEAYAIGKLRRALSVSIQINSKSLIQEVKNGIILLENKIGINDKPGLWGFTYDLLIAGKKKLATIDEESEIIKTLHDRLETTRFQDLWAAECAVKRLAQYYNLKSDKIGVKNVLIAFEEGVQSKIKDVPVFQQQHNIEKLYMLNKQFQLNADAERLLIRLRQISKDVVNQMKKVASTTNISVDDLDKYTDNIYKGNSEAIFYKIVHNNIPKVVEAKTLLKEHAESSALFSFFPKGLIDDTGRTVAKVGSLIEDLESNIVSAISTQIQIGALFLHFIYEEGIKREMFTAYEICKLLEKSCIIKSDRFIIIQKGLEAYFKEDYITAIHLFIPQFEEAIRNLIEMNGGNVLIAKDDIFNLKTFDHLLGDKIIFDVFGEDTSIYFRTLFTDKRGRNLRNKVAHGLTNVSEFDKQNADRVLHAVLCLGFVRLIEG